MCCNMSFLFLFVLSGFWKFSFSVPVGPGKIMVKRPEIKPWNMVRGHLWVMQVFYVCVCMYIYIHYVCVYVYNF